jgi:hypothetical protein
MRRRRGKVRFVRKKKISKKKVGREVQRKRQLKFQASGAGGFWWWWNEADKQVERRM